MNICIRLPNWLGDMVMSTAFVKAVAEKYPGASIDLVARKGIDALLDHFPPHHFRYSFSKEEYKGLRGAWEFGKLIGRRKQYDLFFCLPDSFSSAAMAMATGARKRIGYKKELRSITLTHTFQKKKGLHRVEEYTDLLQQFTNLEVATPSVELAAPATEKNPSVIININSEASSRRLPKQKAVEIINAVRSAITEDIILVGNKLEKDFVTEVYASLDDNNGIINMAGQTHMAELIGLLGASRVMLSTDSGPAHVANAMGTHTIVLFGAGNEHNTAPWNKAHCSIIRLGKLPCEPCTKNTCKLYGIPECLLQLDTALIVSAVSNALQKKPST